ncbi:MAG: L,D-transpeptidase family protein [Flavobacteriales bacterium]|jgi:hypothetical protein|tara:strand:+ start:13631 stop:14221 length:591 start_codon:yes stop_codon:yes gene_type:complete
MVKLYLTIFISFLSLSYNTKDEEVFASIENYLGPDINKVNILFISIKQQELFVIKEKSIIKKFKISSSKYGTGSKSGSNKTPLGLHSIAKKIGDKTPKNGRMIGRIFNGDIATIYKDTTRSKTDDITSRILWLKGEEKEKNQGHNIDSFNRYIYIHGTSEEGLIGQPASHGCIRLLNKDVIELYKLVSIGTLVLIL